MPEIDWDTQSPEDYPSDDMFKQMEHERRMERLRECVANIRAYDTPR